MMPRASGRTFSVREASIHLKVRTEEVYRLLKEGKLKGHRMSIPGRNGIEWVIPEAEVINWAASKKRRKGG